MNTPRTETVSLVTPPPASDTDLAEFARPRQEDDGRPPVHLTANLAEVIDATEKALASDKSVFVRGAELVHVIRACTAAEADDPSEEGTPQIRPLAVPTLRERTTRVARFVKPVRGGGWKPAIPTDAVIQGLHARGEWPNLRELHGIIETPSMRPDGSLIEEPGYDDATGFLYVPSDVFPRVPSDPTKEDAAQALAALKEVFLDFPFATPAARHVPIAALIALIVRPAIVGAVPAFCYDAPTPGTGKTLCADAVCVVATGRPSPRGTFPANLEELDKVLAAHARQSASIVAFDNVSAGFGGAPLDKCLTATDTVDFRILGKTEHISMRWSAVVLASGNNMAIMGDTARRVLIGALASNDEKPEERGGFTHAPLLPWVISQRPRLVTAALTLVRAYVVAGRPNMKVTPWGSFESFTDLVVSAIMFAGGANVLDARPSENSGDDGERAHRVAILTYWSYLDGGGSTGTTARAAIQILWPPSVPYSVIRPPPLEPLEGHDELREAIEGLTCTPTGKTPDANKLGAQLRRFKDRVIAGKKLTGRDGHGGTKSWSVTHV